MFRIRLLNLKILFFLQILLKDNKVDLQISEIKVETKTQYLNFLNKETYFQENLKMKKIRM